MALKGLGIAWTGVKIASKLRTVVVGGAAAGALYMVTRAHSPKTADKALEIGKDAVDAGGAVGGSFYQGVLSGMGDETPVPTGVDAGSNPTKQSSFGWGGSGSLEATLKGVRGLPPELPNDLADSLRAQGYDSPDMLRKLARHADDDSGWSDMVSAVKLKPGHALKIKEHLLSDVSDVVRSRS